MKEKHAPPADLTAHAAPSIASQVVVGTVTSIGKAVSSTPGVYNPVTLGTSAQTFGGTTLGRIAIGGVELALKGNVLLDAGVYVAALYVCSKD